MDLQSISRQFDEDGFAIVRGVFTHDELAALERELEHYTRTIAPTLEPGAVYYEDSPTRPIKSMFRMDKRSGIFRTLLDDARLLDLGRSVYQGADVTLETTMFFGKPAQDGSEAPPHQDNAFQCWEPPEALTFTIAIDASTTDNGVLICQKGSHQLGLLPHRPSGLMGFSQTLIDPVDTAKFPGVELCMEPGDLCLHSVDTVHRSGPNRTDRSRRQMAISCHSSHARQNDESLARNQKLLAMLHEQKT